MASEYDIAGLGPNTNSTYGDFQYLTCDTIRIDNVLNANKIVVDNNLLVEGNLKTNDVFIGSFDADGNFTESWRLTDKISSIEGSISSIEARLDAGGLFDLSGIETRLDNLEDIELPPVDLSNIESRLDALESIDFTPTDVSSLATGLAALQTRTGTLESLMGLLSNNNPTDTAIENRIAQVERKVDALLSVYNSIKAIHNMPLNL